MAKLILRSASFDDKKLLFVWRNISELVQLSYSKKNVTIEEHNSWFNKKLKSPDCNLHIIEVDNIGIGLIRMDFKNNICELSIYLIPGNQGKGFGFEALSIALYNYKHMAYKYAAKVQTRNIPSQKLFLKLGFIESYRDNDFINYIK